MPKVFVLKFDVTLITAFGIAIGTVLLFWSTTSEAFDWLLAGAATVPKFIGAMPVIAWPLILVWIGVGILDKSITLPLWCCRKNDKSTSSSLKNYKLK